MTAPVESPASSSAPDPHLMQYRGELVKLLHGAHEQYDKALLTLSGGALGLSFAIVDKIGAPGKLSVSYLAVMAWLFWTISVACVLWSFITSQQALKTAIKQVDDLTIWTQKPGGTLALVTMVLNVSGGAFFCAGALAFAFFVSLNF